MSKKQHSDKRKSTSRTVSPKLLAELGKASELARKGRLADASRLLHDLDHRFPGRKEVLGLLMDVQYRLRDSPGYLNTCERLVALRPNNPDILLALAGAYLSEARPALARQAFRRFLERWPDHLMAGEARDTLADIESGLQRQFSTMELSGPEGDELILLHEEVQVLLHRQQFAESRAKAEELLRRRPNFPPALNNMSLAYFFDGRTNEAIASAERVLSFEPNNFHALANLTMFQCLSGRTEDARATASRLQAVTSDNYDVWVKKAEALSMIGAHQGIVDNYRGWEQARPGPPLRSDAYLLHLSAAAFCRLGNTAEAERLWKQALDLQPGLELARENLSDLRKPAAQRHGPWAFPLNHWSSQKAITDLRDHLSPRGRKLKDDEVQVQTRSFLQAHPEFVALVPLMLERGDPHAREFALHLASWAETPEMLAALRDFALSDRGPDNLRMRAAEIATRNDYMSSGPVRMWAGGEWREVRLQGYEIHGELLEDHPPHIQELLRQGTEALHNGDAVAAEQIFRQVIQERPEFPSAYNNLAMSCMLQDKHQEAADLVKLMRERFPDYLFGRVAAARTCISAGDLAGARALINPLLDRKRFHFNEISALLGIQIELALAEGQVDAARSHLKVLEGLNPEDRNLYNYRLRIRQHAGGR